MAPPAWTPPSSWSAAIERWEKALQNQLAPSTLRRYRYVLLTLARYAAKTALEPDGLTREALDQWLEVLSTNGVGRNTIQLSNAAASQLLEVMKGTLRPLHPTPAPADKRQAMRPEPQDEVEPIEIGPEDLQDDSEEDVTYSAQDDEGEPEPEPAPAPPPRRGGTEVTKLADSVAQDAVREQLLKRLAKANEVKAQKTQARRAAKAAVQYAQATGQPMPAPVAVVGRSAVPTPLMGLRFPPNQKVALHKRRDDGSLSFCKHYNSTDFRGTSADEFVAKYAVPLWGHGAYELSLLDANNQPLQVYPITVEAPLGDGKAPGMDDPLYVVKELLKLSQDNGPGVGTRRAQLLAQLGLDGDRPLTARDLERIMAQPQAQPGMDVTKVFELAERLMSKREAALPPLTMVPPAALPPAGPDPTMMLMVESMKAQTQMMMGMFQAMFQQQRSGPDPLLMDTIRAERDRAARLEQRIENMNSQAPARTLADALSELKEAQEIVKGVPGFEVMSGENAGLAGFFSKLIENAPAVGEAISKVAEHMAKAKAGAVRAALAPSNPPAVQKLSAAERRQVIQPVQPTTAVRPLPAKAAEHIRKLATTQDDAEMTQAAVDTIIVLTQDSVWAEALKPYQEALSVGNDESVGELIVSLFNFANMGHKATQERVLRIIAALKKMVEPALEEQVQAAAEGEEGEEEEGEEGEEDSEEEDDTASLVPAAQITTPKPAVQAAR